MKWFLCPKCGKLDDTMEETHLEANTYSITIGDWDEIKWELSCSREKGLLLTTHYCGFQATGWDAEDFLVEVKGEKIKPHGEYWKEHGAELRKIVGDEEFKEKNKHVLEFETTNIHNR